MNLWRGGVVDFINGMGGTEYLMSTLVWLGIAVLAYLRMRRHKQLGRSGGFQGMVAGFALGTWLVITLNMLFRS